jgi:hypothetical protein
MDQGTEMNPPTGPEQGSEADQAPADGTGLDEGTEPRFVRCRRCHGVFEAGLANCPRCGVAYVASGDPSAPPVASYADKYHGTQFAEQPVLQAPTRPRSRSSLGILMVAGSVLLVTAVAVGGLLALGAFDAPAPTDRGDVVIARPETPTPVPTLPPIVNKTLAQLADPNLNIHVAIRTTLSINARVTGRSSSQTVQMDVDCSGGNESGIDTSGGVSYEWRLVDGTYYTRRLPTGAWKVQGSTSPFVVLSPLFMLTEARMLQYDGQETKNGVPADKLESTLWWTPNSGKLSGLDVNTLSISPQHTGLQLWVAADGSPVYAVFRAWTDASDTTNLLDITTTYAFSQLGAIAPIPSPTMK